MTSVQHRAYMPVTNETANGKIVGYANIFFAANGTTGYISLEAYDSTIAPAKVLHPYLIKTTNGGSSWGSIMGPNLV